MAHHKSVSNAARHLKSTLSADAHFLEKGRKKERRRQEEMRDKLTSEEEERKGTIIKNLPRLEHGVVALIKLAQTPQMRDLMALASTASKALRGEQFDGIKFYWASRPSGDAWESKDVKTAATRDARVLLFQDALKLEGGAFYAHDLYDVDEAISFSEVGSDKCYSVLEQLAIFPCANSELGFLALDPGQREDCWSPKRVIAQVLYYCSHPKKLQKYLEISMERIMKE